MAKKKQSVEPDRLNLTLTPEQTVKLNSYIIEVAKKQGRVPYAIKTKLLRAALDEWMKNHGEDLDIDWDTQE